MTTISNTAYPLHLRGTLLLTIDLLLMARHNRQNCADDLRRLQAMAECVAYGTIVTHILGYCPGEAGLRNARELMASGQFVLNEDPEDQAPITVKELHHAS